MLKEMKEFSETIQEIVEAKNEYDIPAEGITKGLELAYEETSSNFPMLESIIERHIKGEIIDEVEIDIINAIIMEHKNLTDEEVAEVLDIIVERTTEADNTCGTNIIRYTALRIFVETFDIIKPAIVNANLDKIEEAVNKVRPFLEVK